MPGNACRNLPNAAPTEPCRALTTVASVTGTDATGNACLLSGTDVRAVSVDATAESFTVPPNPILPIDPCRALGPVTLRVSVSIAAGGTLTSASVVGGSVDLLAP